MGLIGVGHVLPRGSSVGMVLLSAGMAIVSAPATGSIISAVPLNRAGVASAVNDTTRELGGALGIAVFGSIVNSAYRSSIDLAGLELSASTRVAAEESIGEAVDAASRSGDGDTPAIIDRAAAAFTDAFNTTSWVAVAIVRRRRRDRGEDLHPSEGAGSDRDASPSRPPTTGNTMSCPSASLRQTDLVLSSARDPDPRLERTRRAVLEAALDLLTEHGYGEVTIEAVAARSGVAKSTIYRHWPGGRPDLVRDAFHELKPPPIVPTDGHVRDRVQCVLEQLRRWSLALGGRRASRR